MQNKEQPTTEAAVVKQVKGTTQISLSGPTPEWARKIVRGLCWLTAIWAYITLEVDLSDFGITPELEAKILKYAAIITGLVSGSARFLGVKPVELKSED